MKKIYYMIGLAAVALLVAIPAVKAQDTQGNIRDRLRQDMQNRADNMRNNQGVRNVLLEKNRPGMATTSTSTRPITGPRGDNNGQGNGRGDDNEGNHGMRERVLELRKQNINRELDHALNNLKQVRARISDRIAKAEQTGRDMTRAKALLVVADTKITAAQTAITLFENTSVVATSTASTTPITGDDGLAKPRKAAADAIKALKDAKNALQAVVVAIAHAMGLRIGSDGRVIVTPTPTPSVTTTPTPDPTPTLTPTPTPTRTPTPTPTPSSTPIPSQSPTPTP